MSSVEVKYYTGMNRKGEVLISSEVYNHVLDELKKRNYNAKASGNGRIYFVPGGTLEHVIGKGFAVKAAKQKRIKKIAEAFGLIN